MKIAFTTKGTDWESKMDPRFGRAEYLLVFDEENKVFKHYDNREIENQAHGAGPQTAQKLFELKPDVLITGNGPGGNAATILEKMDLKIFIYKDEITVKKAFEDYKNNELNIF